jgi:hypothetical protein
MPISRWPRLRLLPSPQPAIVAVALTIVLVACSGSQTPNQLGPSAGFSNPTPSQAEAAAASLAPTPVTTPKQTPKATPKPKPAPNPTPKPKPAPNPTPKPVTGVYGNPWGYDFSRGKVITNPPAAFCNYFPCIPSFWTSTNGYVVQCQDQTFSHSGGRQGVCSHHGGYYRTLYSH